MATQTPAPQPDDAALHNEFLDHVDHCRDCLGRRDGSCCPTGGRLLRAAKAARAEAGALCWVLKPGTGIRCVRIDPDHGGDHANEYVGDSGVTWPRPSPT
ncbi:hypothetical protein [Streptomyces sp. NPDC006645]|uniref:hypothetical protein n=1 Tax=unclassified Streptomyces TaxID=2593676 RepID=UPI0033A4207C